MSRQRLVTRLTMLECRHTSTLTSDFLARLSREYDLDEAEIVVEAERIVTRLREAGAVTWDQQLQFLADEEGISVDDYRAQLDTIMGCVQ